MLNKVILSALLSTVLTSADAALLYRMDWESATQTGEASTSPTSTTTMKDWVYVKRTQPAGSVKVVNRSNGLVRQGNYAGRIFLGGSEQSNDKDTRNEKHRRALVIRSSDSQVTQLGYNQTRWYAWSVLLPTPNQAQSGDQFPMIGDSAAVTVDYALWQLVWYDPGASIEYTPSMYLKERENRKFSVQFGPQNVFFGDSERGVWHDFLLEYKPNKTTGSATTHLRWRKQGGAWTSVVGPNTYQNVPTNLVYTTGNTHAAEVMIYGHFDNPSTLSGVNRVLYVDGPWIGTTEADVTPFFDVPASGGQVRLATPAVTLSW